MGIYEDHAIRIAIIVVAAFVAWLIGSVLIRKAVHRVMMRSRSATEEGKEKREATLAGVLTATLRVVIWVVAIIMAMSEFGLDVGPVLAAAGVLGLAVGFGAQYLIRDVISGLFILLENQYRVGDVACVGTTCGLVEDITLRLTVLRDMDGTVHYIPNGTIQAASNLSKDYSRVNLSIGVSYGANLEKVIAVVNRVGKELAADPAWKSSIISPPQFLRVDDFGESAVIVKILGDTKPIKQWDVTGELRKRLKIAFDKEGIEIPFPQRVIHEA